MIKKQELQISVIRSIQKPIGQLQILLHLYKDEKVTGYNIKYEIGINARTATLALSNLEILKLVRKLKNDYFKLTKKGKGVAEQLYHITKLLAK